MTDTLTQLKQHLSEFAPQFSNQDTFYTNLLKSKSDWAPGNSDISDIDRNIFAANQDGRYETIQKCIALALNLEVPVGEYICTALDRGVPDDAAYILHSNAADEITHYQAFEKAAYTYGVSPELINEASLISNNIPGEHPIFLAGYIELSMFLPVLAILRNYGGSGLRLTTQDVSRDESRHVRTNWKLISDLNLDKETRALREYRYAVLDWLLSDLKDTKKDAKFWRDQSESLYRNKTADGLRFTSKAIRTSFFETPNTALSAY